MMRQSSNTMKERLFEIREFEWDQGNFDKNLLRHNVRNWECEQLFFNQPLLILTDRKHSASEKRWAALGTTDHGLRRMIVFTVRKDRIRVISARDMNGKERKLYEENK